PSKKVQLFKELDEIGSPLVIDESLLNECRCKTGVNNTDAEFNILAHTCDAVASGLFINFPGDPHIKAARVEGAGMMFVAANATGGKRRSHGVANCFLDGRET